MTGADRAIRVSTAVAVLGVAGIAAYVSYWHAYEVVRAHGESGVTARLEPATIDGLVYASSMVVLYAARHQLAAPASLARWLLALGIVATLAANVAHGWSHGPVGAAVAAWPAASLVGSYELLLWLIRTAASDIAADEPDASQGGGPADHPVAELRLVPMPVPGTPVQQDGLGHHVSTDGPQVHGVGHVSGTARASEPEITEMGQKYRAADQMISDPATLARTFARSESSEDDINAAAVAAYRTSVSTGRPLSERKLAAMFGKSSRRWARNRMADARDNSDASVAASG